MWFILRFYLFVLFFIYLFNSYAFVLRFTDNTHKLFLRLSECFVCSCFHFKRFLALYHYHTIGQRANNFEQACIFYLFIYVVLIKTYLGWDSLVYFELYQETTIPLFNSSFIFKYYSCLQFVQILLITKLKLGLI